MELTASNSNTTVPKRGTRHGICALRQALMGPHFAMLWDGPKSAKIMNEFRNSVLVSEWFGVELPKR